MISFNKLYYFKSIVETGNISTAAKDLYMTQSALSKALKELEAELGFSLFIRGRGKKIQLNEKGELLYKRTCELMEVAELIEKEFKTQIKKEEGLRIDADYDIVFEPFIKWFIDLYPQKELQLFHSQSNVLEKIINVVEKRIDIAMISVYPSEKDILTAYLNSSSGLWYSYLLRDTLLLKVSPKCKVLKEKASIRELDFRKCWMTSEKSDIVRKWVEDILLKEKINCEFPLLISGYSIPYVLDSTEYVFRSQLLASMINTQYKKITDQWRSVELTDQDSERDVFLICLEENREWLLPFCDKIKEIIPAMVK